MRWAWRWFITTVKCQSECPVDRKKCGKFAHGDNLFHHHGRRNGRHQW